MKLVILAGGMGTRISEESHLIPKPMIQIGSAPILWHIMKIYTQHGITDFVICLGYKGNVIKNYFANYFLYASDVTFDLAKNSMTVHEQHAEPWRVTLVETGEKSMTGGRIARCRKYLDEEDFCMTYGDGVADIDIQALLRFHQAARARGQFATVTAVQPPGRYGSLDLAEERVAGFLEKPIGDGGWINGGFFVLGHEVFDYIEGDATSWEEFAMPRIARTGGMAAYRHEGFWAAMDTLRDKNRLEELWASGNAPWKCWS